MFCLTVLLILAVNISAGPSVLLNPLLRNYRSRNVLPIAVETSPSIIETIAAGSQLAVEHCQRAFQWEKWNCPKSTFTRKHKLLPTKETAYAKAIIAAGIAYEITRNCSKGSIKGCGCDQRLGDPTTPPNDSFLHNSTELLSSLGIPSSQNASRWSWGGCSDDPSFGIAIAQKFLHAVDNDMEPAAYVARHNSKVGGEIVRSTMVRKCRCHGVSGSCSLQTCWMQTASFGEISRTLKERYRRAERLTVEAVEAALSVGNSAIPEIIEKGIEGMESSLVYLEQSPDYCIANLAEGLNGTKGRMCSRNANSTVVAERNSCRNLCKRCGYAVKRLKKTVSKRCNCTFEWCCEVNCATCDENLDEFFCV